MKKILSLDKTQAWEALFVNEAPTTITVRANLHVAEYSEYNGCKDCTTTLLNTARGVLAYYCPKCNKGKATGDTCCRGSITVRRVSPATDASEPSQITAKAFNKPLQALKAYEAQHMGEEIVFLVNLKKKSADEYVLEEFTES